MLSVSELSSSAVRYVSVFSNGLGNFFPQIFPFSSVNPDFGSLLLLSVKELMFSIIIPCENISLTFSPVGPNILSRLCLLPNKVSKLTKSRKNFFFVTHYCYVRCCRLVWRTICLSNWKCWCPASFCFLWTNIRFRLAD